MSTERHAVHAKQHQAIAELGLTALRETSIKKVLDQATVCLADTLEVEVAGALEVLPGGDQLILRAATGMPPGSVDVLTFDTGTQSQSGYTLLQNEPVVVPDLRNERRFSVPPVMLELGFISGMLVVVHGSNEPWGTLGVQTTLPRVFTEDDINFLQGVANILAASIQRRAAEERAHFSDQLLDAVDTAVIAIDPQGSILRWNSSAEKLYGWTAEEVVGRNVRSLGMVKGQERRADEARIEIAGGGGKGEWELRCKDGTPVTVLSSYSPVHSSDGSLQAMVGVSFDISEQKKAEAERAAADTRFRAIFESAELGVAISNRDRSVVETNPAFRRMLGYTEEELRTMSFRGLTHPEDEQQTERLHNRLLDGGIDDYSWEKRYIRKDGSTLWASVTVSLLPWATADEWNSVAILQDITTRRLAEKRLAESEERYRALFDHNSDAVFSVDLKGNFTSANPACEKLSGYILDELQGSSFLPLLFQEDVGRVFEHFLAAARGEPQEYRLGLKRKDGERVELVVNNVPIIQAGVVEGVFGIAKDVTEAVRARRELRKSEVKFRRLFDANPWPMWVGDLDTLEFLEVNDAAASHYGYTRDELLALSLSDIRPPEDMPGLIADCARVEEGYRGRTLSRHLQKDGTPIDVQVSSHGIPFDGRRAAVIVAEDVTEKLRIERENAVLQSQLRQAERMEVVGQLAGGVAHDFNNLLFVIQANSRFVVDTLPADDDRVEDLQHVLDACERGANLVRQLLTFSRKEAIEPRPLNINNSIKSVETMLRRSLGARIDLTIDLDPSPPVVLMDSHQVEQILLNLVLNSRDALSHDGHVSIKTDTPHLSAGELKGAGQDGCPPGDYVRVSVADNGSGMTMEVQKKIFEPFFSTKERDKGTGLGLATVYGIVKQAGGYIQIDSEADLGTKIDVYLPVTPPLTETEPEGDRHAAPRGQGETILVAEDETAVGSAVARILSKNGYAVIKAGSGDEALRLFEEHDSHISLVLTDLNMPRMSGRELAERIRTRRSETKVLFMSGYSGDTNEQHQVVASGEILLQKPFTADHLLGQIRASLEPSSAQRLTGMPEA